MRLFFCGGLSSACCLSPCRGCCSLQVSGALALLRSRLDSVKVNRGIRLAASFLGLTVAFAFLNWTNRLIGFFTVLVYARTILQPSEVSPSGQQALYE